jgi:HlyD family secretion protein
MAEVTSTRTRIFVAAAVLVLATAGGLAWRWWLATPPDGLIASGTIEATELHLSFRVSGRLIERPVDEGSRVVAGQLIGRLESQDLEAEMERLLQSLRSTETQLPLLQTAITQQERLTASRISQAQASLRAREEYLAQLKAGSRRQEIREAEAQLRRARATLDNTEADYRRMESLFEKLLIAQQQRDTARTAYEVAVQEYQAAQERLDMVREGPRLEEVRRAEADVSRARASLIEAQTGELEIVSRKQQLATLQANVRRDQAALAVARAQLGYTVLPSPQAGVVLRKHVEPGEIVPAGTPVVTIADLSNIWVKIYVPEPQLGRVKLGQSADVTTDSYRGKVYRGTVTFISSEAEFTPKNIQTPEERVKLVFAAKVGLANPDQELKPGMPADVKIRYR